MGEAEHGSLGRGKDEEPLTPLPCGLLLLLTTKQAPKAKGKAAETMELPLGDDEIEELF
jgi:hypothetical protein